MAGLCPSSSPSAPPCPCSFSPTPRNASQPWMAKGCTGSARTIRSEKRSPAERIGHGQTSLETAEFSPCLDPFPQRPPPRQRGLAAVFRRGHREFFTDLWESRGGGQKKIAPKL